MLLTAFPFDSQPFGFVPFGSAKVDIFFTFPKNIFFYFLAGRLSKNLFPDTALPLFNLFPFRCDWECKGRNV
ncbi:hypothetical protein, partial [Mucilaginibacter aquatilis]|uniref:hypothetical protein n=1 Tax=Mucilaginibacter aquatilis TaxID=1517760 RepID=UPI001E659159